MTTPVLTPAAPIIRGNRGSLFLTTWPNFFDTSTAGNYTVDIPYSALLPSGFSGTPELRITNAHILVLGVQTFNRGWCAINIEPEGSNLNWNFICHVEDGEVQKRESFPNGVAIISTDVMCFSARWGAYSAGPDGYGGSSTLRQINVQLQYEGLTG